ncbi:uncharacterized protein A4U43_C07F27250 [Asparagus officinalis]|uniref:Uncharacterized protein n=1 Tax=Asparagus officinalis TaxID=4686 RepID=A0A5P1EIE0_ASPOF|nr:uncharacterized protein A4U43_C07F27250 [Asparagus officinalis]
MRDRRRYLADFMDVGFAGESSPRPGPSHRPGKEPLASVDEVEGVDASSPGPGGDASEGSLKEMSSNDIHQAFQACQAQGASLELALFRRLGLSRTRNGEVDALEVAGGLGRLFFAAVYKVTASFEKLGSRC